MKYLRYDYGNLLKSDKIPDGIEQDDFTKYSQELAEAYIRILDDIDSLYLRFYNLPDRNVDHITTHAERLRERFETMVVLGMGGSALGCKALYSALFNSRKLDREVIALDNVDPHLLSLTLENIDLENTVFNVISELGTTTETMAVFLIILDILKKNFPDSYKERIIITTDLGKNFLHVLVNEEGYFGLKVPYNVGGGFSILSDVGLLSSAFAGIDIAQLLQGAAAMRERCLEPDISRNPAYLNGFIHYIYYKKGYNISVMMPYSNDLYDLSEWYKQLWAESLGKKEDDDGSIVYIGQTPIKALGTTDQHSQLQLYMEGPKDKVITFLEVEEFDKDYVIPNVFPDSKELSYLAGKSLSDLLNIEKKATELALYDAGRPNCTIKIPKLSEFHIGEFIFMYEAQTVYTGYLMNIDPLGQPGVEAGKKNTMALLGKAGFEDLAKSIQVILEEKNRQGAIL